MSSISVPDLDTLRAALAHARAGGRSYPAPLRARVVAAVRRHQQDGGSPSAAALRLGLAPTTVLGWLRDAPVTSPFVPVVVRELARSEVASLCLILPGGARVLGLSLDDIAALCRKVAS